MEEWGCAACVFDSEPEHTCKAGIEFGPILALTQKEIDMRKDTDVHEHS